MLGENVPMAFVMRLQQKVSSENFGCNSNINKSVETKIFSFNLI